MRARGLTAASRSDAAPISYYKGFRAPRQAPLRRRGGGGSSSAGASAGGAHGAQGPAGDSPSARPEPSDPLSSEFSRLVNSLGLHAAAPARPPRPSHLMPPTAVVAAVMEALQRPDWPDPGAGLLTAFHFAMPLGCGGEDAPRTDPRSGQQQQQRAATSAANNNSGGSSSGGSNSSSSGGGGGGGGPISGPTAAELASAPRRAWAAAEAWLGPEAFAAQLTSPPFGALIGFDAWRPASELVFTSRRAGCRAAMAVEVFSSPAAPGGGGGASGELLGALGAGSISGGGGGGGGRGGGRGGEGGVEGAAGAAPRRFTFLLECVDRPGGYKGCWLTVGVRAGDYTQ